MTAPATQTRLMTRSEAAEYCRLSRAQFSQWVHEGRLSPAIPGTHRWDRHVIDRDLDRLSGIQSKSTLSPLEQWKADQRARSA